MTQRNLVARDFLDSDVELCRTVLLTILSCVNTCICTGKKLRRNDSTVVSGLRQNFHRVDDGLIWTCCED